MQITKRELKVIIEEHIRLVNEQSGSRTVEIVGSAIMSAADVVSDLSPDFLRWADAGGIPLMVIKNGVENIHKLVQSYISLDPARQSEKREGIATAIAGIITKMQADILKSPKKALSVGQPHLRPQGLAAAGLGPALMSKLGVTSDVFTILQNFMDGMTDNALTRAVIGDVAEFIMLAMSAGQYGVSIEIDDSDATVDDVPQLASPATEIDITDEVGVNETSQILTQGELRRLITEAFLPNLRSAPIPLTSIADPEFAAAIKGKQYNHASHDTLTQMVREEIKRALSESMPDPHMTASMDKGLALNKMEPPPHDGKTDGEEWPDNREGQEGIVWVWEPARWVTDGKTNSTMPAFEGE